MCLDTGRIIFGEELEYLLAILNSKIFFFAVKKFYGGGGLGNKGIRMKHTFFQHFHAIKPDEELKEKISLELNKNPINYEEIDNIFYELYELTNDEINFIKSDVD